MGFLITPPHFFTIFFGRFKKISYIYIVIKKNSDMDINFSGENSIDINVKEGEKCYMTCNTTEYNLDGNCGVSVGDIETMKEFGWNDEDDIKALESLEIGERYDSEDYYSTAFVIRLG